MGDGEDGLAEVEKNNKEPSAITGPYVRYHPNDDKALPIDAKTLGAYANKFHAFAKALHYKEYEYLVNAQPATIESLVRISNQLQQPDAAIGILVHAQNKHVVQLKESWYEKLQRWDDALLSYKKRVVESPESSEAMFGIMRCKHALGDWEGLFRMCKEKWLISDLHTKKSVAPLAAAGLPEGCRRVAAYPQGPVACNQAGG